VQPVLRHAILTSNRRGDEANGHATVHATPHEGESRHAAERVAQARGVARFDVVARDEVALAANAPAIKVLDRNLAAPVGHFDSSEHLGARMHNDGYRLDGAGRQRERDGGWVVPEAADRYLELAGSHVLHREVPERIGAREDAQGHYADVGLSDG